MRIIAGKWRGRHIEAPPGLATRPTADRVRETLFSMLASRLGTFEDLRVADLFAGSGALGLEALSRGAATATFVENDAAAAAAIRRNAEKFGASVQVLGGSALALPRSEPFDLVLADPPYSPGSGTAVVGVKVRLPPNEPIPRESPDTTIVFNAPPVIGTLFADQNSLAPQVPPPGLVSRTVQFT